MSAAALSALRLIGKIALIAAGIVALMLALVDFPDMSVPRAVPQERAKPVEPKPQTEVAKCLEYQGL
jgi:hypothetical protein